MSTHSDTLEALQREISARACMDEQAAVRHLLAQVAHLRDLEPKIHAEAVHLAGTLREQGPGTGVEAFLYEYGLDTREGVAIMCLAEALLRIPDAETADRLIRGTFEHTEWNHHLGGSDSLFVNASSWGLLLTGKVVHLGADANEHPAHLLKKLAAKVGDPVIREALKAGMRFIGGQFVMGEDIHQALIHSKSFARQGYRFSFDMLGEGARSEAQAKAYVESYREAIAAMGQHAKGKPLLEAPGISVKLSALHARYQLAQADRVMAELLPRLKQILLQAMRANITVAIDAEEATRLDIEMQLFARIFADPDFAQWEGLGFVVQAYQKRAFYALDFLAALAKQYKRRMPLRLVKGAYWDSEIKWAQIAGLGSYPVFTRKEHTDVSYLACADKILCNLDCFYPQFATHNARTIATIITLAEHYGLPTPERSPGFAQAGAREGTFEIQRLHGMGEKLHGLLLPRLPSRIYAPVGRHKDLLAYLIRRLLENGANTSFINLLMDANRPIEELIADPVLAAQARDGAPNPQIPLPPALYDTRKNSGGMDFGNLAEVEALARAMQPFVALPLAPVTDATPPMVEEALKVARAAFPVWENIPVTERYALLEKAADALEAHRPELMALLAREAGKTLPDALSEVREAADFCRYYALHARRLMGEERLTGPTGESNTLSLHPRGVFACISPWNFPLAIFTGQITAALATGNCVVAKPAEQTPRIAARAVELLHQAGIPRHVLQLLPGSGEAVGAKLVADPRIDGVVFTGGTDTAQKIAQSLSERKGPLVPLIAETGGQNCMVVDSSALIEQAVDDIVLSAFGSAGQRCSCLRVLFVQEEVADSLLELLAGAMQELRLGDPLLLSTDIGSVIDKDAHTMLQAHITAMKKSVRFIAATPAPHLTSPRLREEEGGGNFVAPHAFEIPHIGVLQKEVFGPVLHIIRFRAGAMQEVADAINGTGYGLTFGIHSRIDDNVRFFTSRIRAGNIYVNRSMIGATVGVQPFGGEGLSGTGPKAGGPHYLLRFVLERTRTINTAAIGGNLQLLSG